MGTGRHRHHRNSETPEVAGFMEHIDEEIPDPALRCDYLGLWSEYFTLNESHNCAIDAGRAAIVRGNGGKERFYEGLVNAILADLFCALR